MSEVKKFVILAILSFLIPILGFILAYKEKNKEFAKIYGYCAFVGVSLGCLIIIFI